MNKQTTLTMHSFNKYKHASIRCGINHPKTVRHWVTSLFDLTFAESIR